MRGGGKAIVGPRRSGGRGMMVRGKEEEFTCEIAKGTERIKCEGEEKDMGRVKVGDDGFVTKFSMSCFIVRLVYKCGR
jgi:hypothetical protein